jgi:hypothetical protein
VLSEAINIAVTKNPPFETIYSGYTIIRTGQSQTGADGRVKSAKILSHRYLIFHNILSKSIDITDCREYIYSQAIIQ